MNDLNFRPARNHEIFKFFRLSYQAEQPEFRGHKLVLLLILIFQILNLLMLGFPYWLLKKILLVIFMEQDSEIVGGFTIVDKSKRLKPYYYFGAFFVKPKHQGRGLGRKGMDRLVEEYGHARIRLDVDKSNKIAVSLYQKYGFQVFDTHNSSLLMVKIPDEQ